MYVGDDLCMSVRVCMLDLKSNDRYFKSVVIKIFISITAALLPLCKTVASALLLLACCVCFCLVYHVLLYVCCCTVAAVIWSTTVFVNVVVVVVVVVVVKNIVQLAAVTSISGILMIIFHSGEHFGSS